MDLPSTPEQFIADSNKYLDLLKQDDYWQNIPMLNNTSCFAALKDAQLVRFRGIVQDMHDPEIYLETFEVKLVDNSKHTKCAKYRDNLNLAVSKIVSKSTIEQYIKAHEKSPLPHSVFDTTNERRSNFIQHFNICCYRRLVNKLSWNRA